MVWYLGVLKRDRKSQPFRILRLFGLLMVWFVASQHCPLVAALARSGNLKERSANCCHRKPVKQPDNSPCCKKLVPAAVAPIRVSADANWLKTKSYPVAEVLPKQVPEKMRIASAGTGPPPMQDFNQSVLKRSLRAHAPPLS